MVSVVNQTEYAHAFELVGCQAHAKAAAALRQTRLSTGLSQTSALEL